MQFTRGRYIYVLVNQAISERRRKWERGLHQNLPALAVTPYTTQLLRCSISYFIIIITL